MLPRFLTVLLALAIACGSDDGEAADVGPSVDDVGPSVDDVGPSVDAGTQDDSGSGSDAGPDAATGTVDCERIAFDHDGTQRGYLLCLPQPLPPGPIPVVFAFHGGGGNAVSFQGASRWDELAARDGFAVVFAQGCPDGGTDCRQAASNHWNVEKPGEERTIDDVGYVRALRARLASVRGLEVGAVFGTGHSLGGMMIYRLRCDAPELFDAVGPVSATPVDGTCTPSGDAPIFHVHGAADDNVPFETGCCSAAQQRSANAEYLAECEALPLCFNPTNWWSPVRDGVHPFTDLVGLDEIAATALDCDGRRETVPERAECERYLGCRAPATVETCLVPGAEHSYNTFEGRFDVTEYLWARFRETAGL